MVKMWAEKEMRNLARLHAAGIRCPTPLQLRTHVLVMDFIGREGVAALRLKVSCFPCWEKNLVFLLSGKGICGTHSMTGSGRERIQDLGM